MNRTRRVICPSCSSRSAVYHQMPSAAASSMACRACGAAENGKLLSMYDKPTLREDLERSAALLREFFEASRSLGEACEGVRSGGALLNLMERAEEVYGALFDRLREESFQLASDPDYSGESSSIGRVLSGDGVATGFDDSGFHVLDNERGGRATVRDRRFNMNPPPREIIEKWSEGRKKITEPENRADNAEIIDTLVRHAEIDWGKDSR